ncbi:hypothetical protein ABPG75_004616 [Micractinium tetrahymenae]
MRGPLPSLALAILLVALACCPGVWAGTVVPAIRKDPFCTQCVPRGSACPQCRPHFRVASGTCKACLDPACSSCNAAPGRCTDCLAGYMLVNGVCKPAPYDTAGRCSSCQLDNGCAVPKNGTCVPCSDPHCSYPLGNRCQLCKLGYGPKLGLDQNFAVLGGCVRCAVPRCAKCSLDKYTTCDACVSGYTTVKGKCVECPRHCLSCSNNGPSACDAPGPLCPGCEPGFGPNGKGGCVPCADLNCQSCSDNSKICEACDAGFTIINGTCAACKPKNCQRCFADLRTCTACAPPLGQGRCRRLRRQLRALHR